MANWIFGVIILLLSPTAWGAYDISCVQDDCLTYGWEVVDQKSGIRSEVECEEESCVTSGWREYQGRRWVAYTQCLFDDCFRYGWEIREMPSHRKVAEVRCERLSGQEHNCLTAGWTTHIVGRGYEIQTECIAQDCSRFGWDVYYPNGRVEVARCKDEACFTSGWRLNP